MLKTKGNKMRLIDADKLLDYIDVGHLRSPTEICFSDLDVKNIVDKSPTSDMIKIIGAKRTAIITKLIQLIAKNAIKDIAILIKSGRYIEVNEVVWKPNIEFTDTLKYSHYSRGRSSAKIHFASQSNGKKI